MLETLSQWIAVLAVGGIGAILVLAWLYDRARERGDLDSILGERDE
jgi:hypothetical protein